MPRTANIHLRVPRTTAIQLPWAEGPDPDVKAAEVESFGLLFGSTVLDSELLSLGFEAVGWD